MLIYNFNHMLNYSILQYILIFLDTVIYAIKAKYEFNKIYSSKTKYKLLFIATL